MCKYESITCRQVYITHYVNKQYLSVTKQYLSVNKQYLSVTEQYLSVTKH